MCGKCVVQSIECIRDCAIFGGGIGFVGVCELLEQKLFSYPDENNANKHICCLQKKIFRQMTVFRPKIKFRTVLKLVDDDALLVLIVGSAK